ncbi:MAG: hypothetical protein NZ108_02720, partial [Bacteroidia bacterium]|nr:hypothetical protein [Bacteroidia bacterium]
MNRREFLWKTGLVTAGLLSAPTILPSGSLFAKTGSRRVNHVVWVLFAGGVRSLESVQKAEGNLMPNILNGTEPISQDIASILDPLPPNPLSQPIQRFGTLFKKLSFKRGPTAHFNGHVAAITGKYNDNTLNVRSHPPMPTVFEYFRKHGDPTQSALKTWWISNTLGSFPLLNYSLHPD